MLPHALLDAGSKITKGLLCLSASHKTRGLAENAVNESRRSKAGKHEQKMCLDVFSFSGFHRSCDNLHTKLKDEVGEQLRRKKGCGHPESSCARKSQPRSAMLNAK